MVTAATLVTSQLMKLVIGIALCCLADLFVLRAAWTGLRVADGQYRRGYFEGFADGPGLAVDAAVRPVFPASVLTGDGALAVPPGMTAVVPLGDARRFDIASDLGLAPYVVIGIEAPLAAEDLPHGGDGEARLARGRTLAIDGGAMALVPWDADRPWREDARRLSELRDACVDAPEPAILTIEVGGGQVEFRLGRCTLRQPMTTAPSLLAALAGPEWITVSMQPGWVAERWYVGPLVAAVVVKVAAIWWALGGTAAVVVSAALVAASQVDSVAATMTFPVALAIGVISAMLRLAWLIRRHLHARWRLPSALAVVVVIAVVAAGRWREPRFVPPIMRLEAVEDRHDQCAVLGYSTAGGASLRGADMQHGRRGLRWFLNETCGPCQGRTGALFGGGQTLDWARETFCASPESFAADGHVVFLGAANDDFMWGMLTLARLFIVGEQGSEPWRRSQGPAAAASLAHLDAQENALAGLIECARSRRAGFVFLHDFLVTDMVAGRDADRAAMLERRRAVVDAAGGTFVDLAGTFADQAGIAWFNDYVHPSLIAHERIAALACDLLQRTER